MLPLKLLLIQYLNYNIIPNISNDNKQSESNNKSEQKKNIISDKSSSQKISDIEKQRKFLASVGSSRDAQPSLEYSINEFGQRLIENGFE